MTLGPDLAGRSFGPTEPYAVTAGKVREFNAALGAEPVDGGGTAPLTFATVVAFAAVDLFLHDADVGIELRNIVHGDQRFAYERPLRTGDRVTGTLVVEKVRQTRGMDLISTRTDIATTDGEPVATGSATFVHRARAGGEADPA